MQILVSKQICIQLLEKISQFTVFQSKGKGGKLIFGPFQESRLSEGK